MSRKGLAWAVTVLVAALIVGAVSAQEMTPAQVTESFYTDYLDYARNTGNPLVDQVYQDSPYLSAEFVEKMDDLLATNPGYDPFLLAQDVPQDIRFGQAVLAGDQASVPVRMIWANCCMVQRMAHDLTVDLKQVDGQWQIVDITDGEGALVRRVVESFYADYLDYARNTGNPLVDQVYQDSPYLSANLIARIDQLVKKPLLADPFLCAQDVPAGFGVSDVTLSQDTAAAAFYSLWPSGPDTVEQGNGVTVDLERSENGGWQIAGVTCATSQ